MRWADCRAFWPNAATSRFVEAGPRRWHLQETGSGPHLLLLHGAGASTHSWRDLLPGLAADFRAVALDLPGQGFTTLGTPGRSGLDPMAADIAGLLADQRIEPAVLVGHSAGAAIACRLALDLPTPPRALVSINGALGHFRGRAGDLFPGLARLLATSAMVPRAFAALASSRRVVRHLIASTGSTLDARGLELYRRLLSDREHVAGTLAMMAQWDLTRLLADLPRLTVPSLFLVGDRDLAVPPETSERPAATVVQGELLRLPMVGHLAHEERPDLAVRHVREFVRRVGAPAEAVV